MGMYTYLTIGEVEVYQRVQDKDLNEIFQEVRALIPNILIQERLVITKRLFRKPVESYTYTIYNLSVDDMDEVKSCIDSIYEVRVLNIKTTEMHYVANYLFGLFNGYRSCVCDNINSKKPSGV